MTRNEAVRQLYKLGARFILCEGKQPKHQKGIYDSKRISVDDVIRHLDQGENVGLEPFSLGYGVIDVDGVGKEDPEAKTKNSNLAKLLIKHMGSQGLAGRHPSLSFEDTGRLHLWYKINTKSKAPLGLKANGDPYLSAPTDMRFANSIENRFDIRYKNSYVIASEYFIQLATQVDVRKNEAPNPRWEGLIFRGMEYRKKKVSKKTRVRDRQKEEFYKKANINYLAKIELPDEGEGHHNVANKVGFKVGSESHFNPWFREQAEARLKELGLKDERWDSFEKGIEDGEREPVEEQPWIKNVKVHLKEFSTIRRCKEAFELFEWKFRYDETLNSVEFNEHGGEWKPMEKANVDDMWVKVTDSCLYVKGEGDDAEVRDFNPPYATFDRCITSVALESKFNPIKEFIDSIPDYDENWGDVCWMLFDKFGIEHNDLNHFASKWIFAPAYYYNSRKFYIPVRPMVVLTGPQDIGKSAIIREIIPREFRDRLHGPHFDPSASEKEKIEAVMGRILVECGEMQRHTSKTLESYKAFSQKTMDSNVRLAYRRNTAPIPRTAWPVGTSNKHDCLPLDDTEGQANTRFLPVACTKGFDVEAWMDQTGPNDNVTNRMKIWAQVKHWVEDKLMKNEKMRMPFDLSEQQFSRLNKHVYVESALDMVVEDLTLEIEYRERKDGSLPKGYRIGELMKTKSFVDGYLGSRSDFTRSRTLEMKLGPALTKSGLWVKKNVKINRTPALRWVRTQEKVSASAISRFIDNHGEDSLSDHGSDDKPM